MENALYPWTGIVIAHCEGGEPLYMELFFFDNRRRIAMRYNTCMCELTNNDPSPQFDWYYNSGSRIGQFTYE